MRAGEVVVVQPGLQVLVALLGVGPVTRVSPLAQGGLDEAFGFAVGARSIGAGEAVTKAELQAGLAELAGLAGQLRHRPAPIGPPGRGPSGPVGIGPQPYLRTGPRRPKIQRAKAIAIPIAISAAMIP